MIHWPDMLAKADDEMIKLVIIAAVIVVSLVGKLFKKKAQQPPPRQAPAHRPAQRPAEAQPAAPRPNPSMGQEPGPARRTAMPTAVRPIRMSPQGEPLFPPAKPPQRRVILPAPPIREEHVRTIREAVDMDTVDEEVERKQQGLAEKAFDRQRRLQAAPSPEADTAAIDARISHFQRMEQTTEQAARTRVDLANPRSLRAAIIYHEILSSAKALREGPEMWDR